MYFIPNTNCSSKIDVINYEALGNNIIIRIFFKKVRNSSNIYMYCTSLPVVFFAKEQLSFWTIVLTRSCVVKFQCTKVTKLV